MPHDARLWLITFLQELRDDARSRAVESLRRHKAPLFLYWKVVAVYSSHLIKVLRRASAKAVQ